MDRSSCFVRTVNWRTFLGRTAVTAFLERSMVLGSKCQGLRSKLQGFGSFKIWQKGRKLKEKIRKGHLVLKALCVHCLATSENNSKNPCSTLQY
jgi:hypothetical protein